MMSPPDPEQTRHHHHHHHHDAKEPWVSKSYLMGIGFIVSVSVIWAASSVLIQHIYTDTHNTFHSPFLVTYIGISLFTLWLPTQQIIRCLQQHKRFCCGTTSCSSTDVIHPSSHRNLSTGNTAGSSNNHIEYETIPVHSEDDQFNGEIPVEKSSIAVIDDESPIEEDHHRNDDNDDDDIDTEPVPTVWTEWDHFYTAIYIAPVWFIANWSYNTSLIYTTITSSTVLASTGSLFTYIFAIVSHDEQINTLKFVGVCLGVLGSFITTLSDTTTPTNSHTNVSTIAAMSNDDFTYHESKLHDDTTSASSSSSSSSSILPMVGDLLGFISAIGYGAYAVQTRIYCPKNESLYSMQTLLGYIGLCNFVVLSPFAFYVLLSGESSLTWVIFGFLVLKGLFDNVLSDYLWLRAVILTNATTATVGLGLTIPLAFASDILLGKQSVLSTEQLVGAITVLVGFVLVNIGNNNATDNTTEMGPTTATNTNILTTGGGYDQIPITIDEDNSQRGQEIVSLPPLHVIS